MPPRPKGTGIINKRQTQLMRKDALARGLVPFIMEQIVVPEPSIQPFVNQLPLAI
jgi:hypothetical protein